MTSFILSELKNKQREVLDKDFCLDVYTVMLKNRYADEKMKKLVRQNKGGSFHLSTQGHEMIGAVCGVKLTKGVDWGLPYYRDRTFAIGLGCDLKDLFGTFLARAVPHHSMGRMMPEHFSHKALRIPCQSSVVGSQFLHAVGVAKSAQLRGKQEVVYVSAGDGATSQGEFHEALNFSSIHKIPVVFVIQDNGWAISVPSEQQTAGGDPALFMRSYPGLTVYAIDGCDIEAVHDAVNAAYTRARNGEGPSVIVAKVPRLGAHSSSDDPTKYQENGYNEALKERDPITLFEKYLLENLILSPDEILQIRAQISDEIERAALDAEQFPFPKKSSVLENVYVPFTAKEVSDDENHQAESIVMVDALNHALKEEMEKDPGIVVFGQDVAYGKGGVFGATRYLTELFGENRCFNTPLAEATIIALALGLSLDGFHKPVAEIQFADYLWTGINQLFNEVSSFCYRSNGEWHLPIVIRMPIGGYIQGGPYHSQSIEAYLAHCPGLKIVYPSNAHDAKCLLKAAIQDPNPVIFLEHKGLYRQRAFSARKEPSNQAVIPLGKANVVKEGKHLTLIAWGMLVVMGYEVAQQLEQEGISVEVIDLRTINPLDEETIFTSVKKTAKVLIAHEAAKTCGFGAEIAARISHELFSYLDAPIERLCGLDCPVAYSKDLEDATLPQKEQLIQAIRLLHAY